ncbi:hypothetical protein D3C71_919060 [compost metagenome]
MLQHGSSWVCAGDHAASGLPCCGGVLSYIGAAHWFTTSTAFTNLARLSAACSAKCLAGAALTKVQGFVIAHLVGARLGLAIHLAFGPTK